MSETTDVDYPVVDGADVAPETILPAGYHCVKSFCGALTEYAVYLCNWVPEKSESTESDSKEPASKEPKSNQVVIVKFANKESAELEIKSLKLIKDALKRNTEVAGHFVSLLDHNKLDDAALKAHPELKDYLWFSMEAVIPPFTLTHMITSVNDDFYVLQALPLEFFTQMCSALSFLHNEAKIAQGDLHEENVLIRFIRDGGDNAADETKSPTTPTYRLQFVLIDFGHSAHIDAPAFGNGDVEQLLSITVALCDAVQEDITGQLDWDEIEPANENVDWDKFTNALKSMRQVKDNIEIGKTNHLEELKKRYGGYAKKMIKGQRNEFDQYVTELLGRMQKILDN